MFGHLVGWRWKWCGNAGRFRHWRCCGQCLPCCQKRLGYRSSTRLQRRWCRNGIEGYIGSGKLLETKFTTLHQLSNSFFIAIWISILPIFFSWFDWKGIFHSYVGLYGINRSKLRKQHASKRSQKLFVSRQSNPIDFIKHFRLKYLSSGIDHFSIQYNFSA